MFLHLLLPKRRDLWFYVFYLYSFFTSNARAWTFVCGFLFSFYFHFLHMVLAFEGSLVGGFVNPLFVFFFPMLAFGGVFV